MLCQLLLDCSEVHDLIKGEKIGEIRDILGSDLQFDVIGVIDASECDDQDRVVFMLNEINTLDNPYQTNGRISEFSCHSVVIEQELLLNRVRTLEFPGYHLFGELED